jgi:hypothetical protein
VLGYSVGDFVCALLCRYQDRERAAEKAFIAKREEEALKKKLAEEAKKKGHTVCPVLHTIRSHLSHVCSLRGCRPRRSTERLLSFLSLLDFWCALTTASRRRFDWSGHGRCQLEGWTVDEWSLHDITAPACQTTLARPSWPCLTPHVQHGARSPRAACVCA